MYFVKSIWRGRNVRLFTINARIKFQENSICYFSTNMAVLNKLIVQPKNCYHDEPVNIKAVGLNPGTKITLTSSIKDLRGQKFMTHLHFLADDVGTVDLNIAESLGGTYTGVFPMAPIACMIPAPKEHKYLRFSKKDVLIPSQITLSLLAGHVDVNSASNPDSSLLLDSVLHERILMAPEVERIPIRSGKLKATLFLPEGDGPFPGVIDMFGTAGGLTEFRAAQLANRGIAALALAYYDFEEMSKELASLDIAYFEEAARFLISHPKVVKSGIGAIGVSKGGDLVCSMGTFIPEVKAVVCINGLPVNTMVPLKVKDQLYPGLNFDISKVIIIDQHMISSFNMMQDSEDCPETHLPLHESNAKFLFLNGLDDRNWKTSLETNRAVRRMKENGHENVEVIEYPGAGHLIEPPFSPFCFASYHPMAPAALMWGGNAKEHCAAQVHSWNKMLNFFKTILV